MARTSEHLAEMMERSESGGPRNKLITFQANQAEVDMLHEIAAAVGEKQSRILRNAIVYLAAGVSAERLGQALAKDTANAELTQELTDVRSDLSRIGNNVNQIARVCNTRRDSERADGWESVRREIEQLREAIARACSESHVVV